MFVLVMTSFQECGDCKLLQKSAYVQKSAIDIFLCDQSKMNLDLKLKAVVVGSRGDRGE